MSVSVSVSVSVNLIPQARDGHVLEPPLAHVTVTCSSLHFRAGSVATTWYHHTRSQYRTSRSTSVPPYPLTVPVFSHQYRTSHSNTVAPYAISVHSTRVAAYRISVHHPCQYRTSHRDNVGR
eukprot:144301-Rhodomonas_salina.1